MFTKSFSGHFITKGSADFLFVVGVITRYRLCCGEDLDGCRYEILVVECLMTFNKIFSYVILACCQVHYTTRVQYTIELALNIYTVFI